MIECMNSDKALDPYQRITSSNISLTNKGIPKPYIGALTKIKSRKIKIQQEYDDSPEFLAKLAKTIKVKNIL